MDAKAKKRFNLKEHVIRCAKMWAGAEGIKACDNAEGILLRAIDDLKKHEKKHGKIEV